MARQLDHTYRSIVNYLIEKPGATYNEVAHGLQLSETAVAKRISRMFDQGILQRAIHVVDWARIGFPFRYRIDIRVSREKLALAEGGPYPRVGLPKPDSNRPIDSQQRLARYLKHLLPTHPPFLGQIVVQDVVILLGGAEADLSATVYARSNKSMLAFVTAGVGQLASVTQSTSSLEAWSVSEGDLGYQEQDLAE